MNRDELILSCQQIVNNLVKKYNNHKPDEDLQSEGMIAVVKCVDRSLDEGMSDVDQIQARCNKWARNAILTVIYSQKDKCVDDETVFELAEAPEDVGELLIYLEQVLTPKQKEVFDLLLQGFNQNEIMTKLNIGRAMYFRHLQNIREKIENHE